MQEKPDGPKYVTPDQFARGRVGRLLRRKAPPTRAPESTALPTGSPPEPDAVAGAHEQRARLRDRFSGDYRMTPQRAYQLAKEESDENMLFTVAIISLFVCAPLAFWPLFAGRGKARTMALVSICLWGLSILVLAALMAANRN